MTKLKVLVIGSGLGGLCLAQALRNNHIDVEVFERDSGPWERAQGYRLHLEADGLNALREVLAPDLHRLFTATAMRVQPFTTILNTDLTVAKRFPTDDGQDDQFWPDFVTEEKIHCNVDRVTLRGILLIGLEKVCHFGKRLIHYESNPNGIVATFADGTVAKGNVLVGADGIRSIVRQQRAPQLQTMDAGVQAIYGRVPYGVGSKLVPAEALYDIFSIAIGERKVFLGLGAVKFPLAPNDAAKQMFPSPSLKEQNDYLVCIVGGRHEHFPKSNKELRGTPAGDLQNLAVDMLKEWPQQASNLVSSGDPSSFFVVGMHTTVPSMLDNPTNITLLGDAVHAMTPTLGRGANLAMRDAALLGRQLNAVAKERLSLSTALTAYEAQLVRYGFDVVRESVHMGEKRMGQNPLPV